MKNYFCELKVSNRGYKGYNGLYVRLYVNGVLGGSAGGGGYDMAGTCFGEWLNTNFVDKLNKLADKEIKEMKGNDKEYNDTGAGIYGLIVSKDESGEVKARASGGTGKEQMFKIIEALGGKAEQVRNKKGDWLAKYIITL